MDDISKIVELGALGAISFILIFKGIGKMQVLTDSMNILTAKIQELNITVTNHFSIVDNRLDLLERDLRDVKYNIEALLRRLENVNKNN